MRRTKKITLCAVLSALSVAVMYIGSFIEVLDISVACIASLVVLFCVEELGKKYAFAVYAAVSLLSFMLLPQKWVAAYFAFFFGIMPITKKLFEKTGKILSWVLKVLVFNAEVFAFYFVAEKLDFFEENETALPYLLVMLVLANLVFVLVDVLYDRMYRIYKIRFQARVRKYLK
ncbi:MAG: hypothetical protein IJX55_03125 [Clostridia bacterium]|nr:hypothetical protein [Clostridia bacterium]